MKHNYLDWKCNLNLLKEDFSDYMSYVSGLEDTIILMSVKDDMFLTQDEDELRTLEKYGINKFTDIGEHESYYAVITPGEIFEDHSLEELSYIGDYNGTSFTIKNAGWDSGYYSSIVVNGKEYSKGERGINIVVYNTKEKKLVDSINYRTNRMAGDRKVLFR